MYKLLFLLCIFGSGYCCTETTYETDTVDMNNIRGTTCNRCGIEIGSNGSCYMLMRPNKNPEVEFYCHKCMYIVERKLNERQRRKVHQSGQQPQ